MSAQVLDTVPDLSPRAYDDNPNSPFYTPPAEREQAALWDAARGKRAPEAASTSQAVPTTPPQVAGLFVFEVFFSEAQQQQSLAAVTLFTWL